MPLGVGALIFLVNSGATQRWVRRELISQIELRTGARVELGGFHLHVWHLDAELHDLTLHGLEPPGVAPLFYAKRVDVRLRILSFFERKVVLEELLAEKPELALRLEKNGVSNIPTPKIAPSNRPWQETLFDLQIGRLELNDGSAYINDRHVPFTLVGQNFNFGLRYVISAPNTDSYVGKLQWEQVSFQAEHDLPFRFDLLAKFTIHRDGFELDQAICKLAHSELDLRAEVPTF